MVSLTLISARDSSFGSGRELSVGPQARSWQRARRRRRWHLRMVVHSSWGAWRNLVEKDHRAN